MYNDTIFSLNRMFWTDPRLEVAILSLLVGNVWKSKGARGWVVLLICLVLGVWELCAISIPRLTQLVWKRSGLTTWG